MRPHRCSGFVVLCFGFLSLCIARAWADQVIFDMESSNPVTNTWIGGTGEGTLTTDKSTAQKQAGSASCLWSYTLPASPGGNYPTIEMSVPPAANNWTGGTALSTWMYFDLTGTKTFWTIQPVLAHPFPTVHEMGNWNADATGVPAVTWIQHAWPINAAWDISNASHLRWYYHAGDGWADIAKGGKVDLYLDDIAVVGLTPPPTVDIIFDMEGTSPVTNTWIGGTGAGTITTSQSTAQKHAGSASLLWSYTLPDPPAGNWPVIEMAIPANRAIWTGSTKLSVWMYFDLTATKTFWTIQPYLAHPYPTVDGLGNWNADTAGVPAGVWTQHLWDINSALSIDHVSHLRFDYATGDGWADIAKNGKVDIYLDDIGVVGSAVPVEISDFALM